MKKLAYSTLGFQEQGLGWKPRLPALLNSQSPVLDSQAFLPFDRLPPLPFTVGWHQWRYCLRLFPARAACRAENG